MSSIRISSPAGGVEGAAASSFIDRLRDGWRPCPYESREPGGAESGSRRAGVGSSAKSRRGTMGQARSPAWSAFTPEARVRDADE